MRFVEVAVDLPDNSYRTFTYSLPSGGRIEVGDLVWVPFRNRVLQAVVFSTNPSFKPSATREIISRIFDKPLITKQQITLANWFSRYYRTNLFTSASLMFPLGTRSRIKTYLKVPENIEPDLDLQGPETNVWNLIPKNIWTSKNKLIKIIGHRGHKIVNQLVAKGYIDVRFELEPRQLKPSLQEIVVLTSSNTIANSLIKQFTGTRFQRRSDLLKYLLGNTIPETRSKLTKKFGRASINWAVQSQQIKTFKRKVHRDPLKGFVIQQEFPLEPNEAQKYAISAINESIDRHGDSSKFLLHGITGSGKTEVYLQSAAHALKSGRCVIVLVPEIALTPQLLHRFASRFPGKVALLHSGLTRGQRFDQWWRIKNGDYSIVLGSRSSIFAPIKNLGLIIIDEEHEWTYKQQDRSPRYHTRVVAKKLASITRSTLVLGSATPSLTSFHETERDTLRLLTLPYRPTRITPSGTDLDRKTEITLVDMKNELRAGHTSILSRPLLDAMTKTLSAGERVILFLNRRGLAGFIQCTNCGTTKRCAKCEMTLKLHGLSTVRTESLICHFCNYSTEMRSICDSCGGTNVRRTGAGTETVVNLVNQYFPKIEVLRWDSDIAQNFQEHLNILNRFENGSANILVGTQMVAKGLDVPGVTLVGAITADIGLESPDFTAAERVYQVLAQVSGRAGRGDKNGLVIIQTMQPDHHILQAVSKQDYDFFYHQEAEFRARYNLPPFARLIKVSITGADPTQTRDQIRELASKLRRQRINTGLTNVEVIGPSPSFHHRVRGTYRWQLIIKGVQPDELLDNVSLGYNCVVDIDPESFL